MCRLMLYLGPETRLSALVVEPDHSLIRQSVHSKEREEPLNGDGFGIGWYARAHSEDPAVFRSITPAWNNRNLQNLARVVASDCVLAHVRGVRRRPTTRCGRSSRRSSPTPSTSATSSTARAR